MYTLEHPVLSDTSVLSGLSERKYSDFPNGAEALEQKIEWFNRATNVATE